MMAERLEKARRSEGETVFDILVELIEDADEVTLRFVD